MDINVSKQMIDITGPEHEVEVLYRNGVLWVNVDGICRLRICQITGGVLNFNIDASGNEDVATNIIRGAPS